MAKRKGRADRRAQRERAVKARERGLPEPAPITEPARLQRPAGDVTVLALRAGRGKTGRRKKSRDQGGVPMFGKLAIAAALILAVVFLISEVRKERREAEVAARQAREHDRTLEDDMDSGDAQDSGVSPQNFALPAPDPGDGFLSEEGSPSSVETRPAQEKRADPIPVPSAPPPVPSAPPPSPIPVPKAPAAPQVAPAPRKAPAAPPTVAPVPKAPAPVAPAPSPGVVPASPTP